MGIQDFRFQMGHCVFGIPITKSVDFSAQTASFYRKAKHFESSLKGFAKKPKDSTKKLKPSLSSDKKVVKKTCPNGKKECYLADVIFYLQGSHNFVPLIQAVIIKPRKAN